MKTIDELTIVDDFMFGAVMRNPRLCKKLLELILGIKIRRIEYPELQKSIKDRFASKGIRLDVYVEDEAGTVYDVEIQTVHRKHLPKRMRYYQGIIDLHILEKGEKYEKLRKSFIIFICTYDPFGQGRWVYTFENRCREDPSTALGDEAGGQDCFEHEGLPWGGQRRTEGFAALYGRTQAGERVCEGSGQRRYGRARG